MKIFLVILLFIGLPLFADTEDDKAEASARIRARLEQQWQAKNYYFNTIYQMEREQWDKAMYSAQKVLELSPDDQRVRILIQEIESKRWEGYKKLYHDDSPARKTIGIKFDWNKVDTFAEEVIPVCTESMKYFTLGERAFELGSTEVAESYYKMAISKSPGFGTAYQRLGEIYFVRDDKELASFCFNKSVEYQKYSQENRLCLANLLLLAHDYDETEKVLAEIRKLDSESEVAAVARGMEFRVKRERMMYGLMAEQKIDEERFVNLSARQEKELYTYAFGHFYFLEKARQANPDFWFINYLLAYAHIMIFSKNEALTAIDTAGNQAPKSYLPYLSKLRQYVSELELKPYQYDSLDFHMARAKMLFEKQFYNDAVSELVVALSLSPDSVNAHLMMGKCFSALNNLTRAIAEFRQCVSLDSKNIEGHYLLGVEYQKVHQYEDAVDTLKTACQLDPKNTDALVRLGDAYLSLEDYVSSLDSFKKAVEINKELPYAYLSMGTVFTEQSEFERAIESFETAIGFKKDYVNAYVNLGIVYYRLWEIKNDETYLVKAISATDEALKYEPDNEIIKDYLNFYKSKK
ncbi:MAG: tetratricopeptide repeat protein [Candidatus Wallbacteria bacterium]|nr:tetratricopeptide repeat protein [Candidatus Wallbacteria bacterium]